MLQKGFRRADDEFMAIMSDSKRAGATMARCAASPTLTKKSCRRAAKVEVGYTAYEVWLLDSVGEAYRLTRPDLAQAYVLLAGRALRSKLINGIDANIRVIDGGGQPMPPSADDDLVRQRER